MASEQVKGEPPQTLNKKTWFLRVSVHCEGCKKKVKKILFQVPGVHSVDIDIMQQRAIVIGNVEVDTLIMKLIKSGKRVELWPEQPMQNEKKLPEKSKKKEKQAEHHHQKSQKNQEHAQVKTQQPNGEKKEANPPALKTEALKQKPAKNSKEKNNDFDVNVKQKSKNNADGNAKNSGKDHHQKVEGCVATHQSPSEVKKHGGEKNIGGGGFGNGGKNVKNKKHKEQNGNSTDTASYMESQNHHSGDPPDHQQKVERCVATHQPPPKVEKHQGEKNNGSNCGGDSGKNVNKKKSKGQNGNSTDTASYMESKDHHNGDPPNGLHQYGHLPLPSNGVSYNTTYPTNSYTTSYYAPYPTPNTYMNSFQGPQVHPSPPPSDPDLCPMHPSESFEMFSDENPNGCLVM